MGTSARRLRVPDAGCPGDQIMWCSRDVHGTSLKQTCVLHSTKKDAKLTLAGYSRLYTEW